MSNSRDALKQERIIFILCLVLAGIGILLRFWNITRSDFIFFDEGFYLNHNLHFGELLARYYPQSFGDLFKAIGTFIRLCLASGKTLWFMTVDSRFFWGGLELWFFPRFVSALVGSLTLGLAFLFARRFFNSSRIAVIATALLAILPSHVFYSRIGLQEAFSTLLVLAGFYFYCFPRLLGPRTFFAGLLMGAAYFSNYRLIMLPVLVAFAEFWLTVPNGQWPQFRKFLWFLLTFLGCVFIIGNIDNGKNTVVTFAWMFHQTHLGEAHFDPVNLLSYPYYLFRLENFLFGAFFFGNLYLVGNKQRPLLLPFLLVCLQMSMFSFAGDKAARYLAVMTPFMAMVVAHLAVYLWEEQKGLIRSGVGLALALMAALLLQKSVVLAAAHSDYRSSADYLLSRDRNVKFVSTQNYVHNLFVPDRKNVASPPRGFPALMALYTQGYRFLVMDPQAYISLTADQKKFSTQLHGYLGFVNHSITPVKTFSHFEGVILERFVFEHSENLRRSIRFLQTAREQRLGNLHVYDLTRITNTVVSALVQSGNSP